MNKVGLHQKIMFGDKDLLAKMAQIKNVADMSKSRLNDILVEGEAGGNLVIIEMNGNRELKKVKINTDLSMITPEDLEDLLCVAFSKALEKVNTINEQEVINSTKHLFPGF